MFCLNQRKTHTIQLIEYIKRTKLLNLSKNNRINGFILVLFHWILTGIPLFYIFFGEINKYYYFSCLIWIIIFIMHFYFKGCILTRVERNIWNEKKWWGPWIFLFTPIEQVGIKINDKLANRIFNLWGGLIVFIMIYRVVDRDLLK
jgi:hypothetical protein